MVMLDAKKFKEESKALRKEVRERTAGYVAAALGLVAGLAWNDAIKSLIEYFFPLGGNTIFAKFLYAILLTLIIVIFTVQILRFVNREEK